jgi:hypothetical protein
MIDKGCPALSDDGAHHAPGRSRRNMITPMSSRAKIRLGADDIRSAFSG